MAIPHKEWFLGALVSTVLAVSAQAEGGARSGTFAWFDLASEDPAASRSFYGDLFEWDFSRDRAGEYWIARSSGTALGGVFEVSPDDDNGATFSQWIAVMAVDNAIDATRSAVARGAQQVGQPVQTGDGTFSAVRDPAGAIVDFYEGPLAFPPQAAGQIGAWAWADHFSPSPSKAARFYGNMFGHRQGKLPDGTQVLTVNGEELGGLVYVPRTKIEPNWLPYVAVADVTATAAKAVDLGGGILAFEDDAAILLDPTGAAIGIIKAGE